MAELVSITYKPKDAPKADDYYTRVPIQTAQLVVGKGIDGDAKGGNPNRQLNIMSASTLEALHAEGLKTEPGQLGEQMIVSGIEVDLLPEGTQLQIGETACVEIIKPRTGCDRFEHIQGTARTAVAGRIGMMAKVVTSGDVRVGDPVTVREPVVG